MSADASRVFAPLHSAAEFIAFLEVQRADFRSTLPGRFARMQALWSDITGGRGSADALDQLERQAHGLAGTGATFGFRDLGESAKALELKLCDYAAPSGATTLADIAAALESVRKTLPGEFA